MLGQRSAQRGMFEADTLFADFVGRRNFYGFLASQRDELFRDEDFAGLYCSNNGRPSIPPSLLATALVLQTYERVSDDEATRRAAFDLQWKVALGVELDVRPFAKSTLQEFRAQLLLHEQTGAIFQQSLEVAKRRGVWKKGHPQHERQQMKLALGYHAHPRTWRRQGHLQPAGGWHNPSAARAGQTGTLCSGRRGYDGAG